MTDIPNDFPSTRAEATELAPAQRQQPTQATSPTARIYKHPDQLTQDEQGMLFDDYFDNALDILVVASNASLRLFDLIAWLESPTIVAKLNRLRQAALERVERVAAHHAVRAINVIAELAACKAESDRALETKRKAAALVIRTARANITLSRQSRKQPSKPEPSNPERPSPHATLTQSTGYQPPDPRPSHLTSHPRIDPTSPQARQLQRPSHPPLPIGSMPEHNRTRPQQPPSSKTPSQTAQQAEMSSPTSASDNSETPEPSQPRAISPTQRLANARKCLLEVIAINPPDNAPEPTPSPLPFLNVQPPPNPSDLRR